MKVELQRDHPLGKAGEVVTVTKERANYLNRVSAAKKQVSHKDDEHEEAPVKKEEKAVKKTKEEKAPKDITTKNLKHP